MPPQPGSGSHSAGSVPVGPSPGSPSSSAASGTAITPPPPPSPARKTTTTTQAHPAPPVTSTVPGGKVVALTFDDGPGIDTKHVLDILDQQKIPATFCQIGRQVADFPDTEQRLGASGYGLCNHTWDHDEMLKTRPAATIASEIDKTQTAIKAATGVTPRYFRAPGGDWGTPGSLLRRELGDRMLAALGWDVDSEDWRKPGVATIVANVMKEVQPGAIILMHDAGGDRRQTVAALPIIITKLRAAGYRFVALP